MEPTRLDFTPESLAKRFPTTFGGLTREPVSPEDLDREQERQRLVAELYQRRRREADAEAFLAQRGARYRHCRLSNFEMTTDQQRRVVDALKSYCEQLPERVENGDGIVLFGPSGTGKDHLMVAVAYAAVRRHGFNVVWKNGVELYGEMRAAIDDERTENDVLGPLRRADILVLSDPLPPEGELTRYQKETLYRVLETRYSARRPTWATLNVKSGSEGGDRLGVACYDRLRDGALCLYCNWPSFRRPATT